MNNSTLTDPDLQDTRRLWVGLASAVIAGLIALVALKERPFQPICIVVVGALLFWLLGQVRRWRSQSINLAWVDQHAIFLLGCYIIGLLVWYGLVLWANPYRYEINNGDAAFTTQTLYNLVHGFRLENSVFTMNGFWTPSDDVRYAPLGVGYVSVFSLHQYILPWLLTGPIYALHPEPPMHIWAIQVVTLGLGLPGIFWACRQLGNSRLFALGCAVAFSLLPQVENQIWFQGYFDPIALGVMPWLYGALFARRWLCMSFAGTMLALVSLPFAYFVIAFGIICAVFFRAIVPGLVVALLGWCVMRLDTSLFSTAYAAIQGSANELPNFFRTFVLERKLESFIDPAVANVKYLVTMLFFVGFLPLAVLWSKNEANLRLLGLWVIMASAFSLMMLRSAAWEANRNALFIVPIFMMSLYACKNSNDLKTLSDCGRKRRELLLAALIAGICFYHPYQEGPLASHLPWGARGRLTATPETRGWEKTAEILARHVPRDAPIVWDSAPEMVAVLANRQHTWHCGRAPNNIQYFVSVGEPRNENERLIRDQAIVAWKKDSGVRVLFDGNPGQRLLIFERLNPILPQRDESMLGWDIVKYAIWGRH